jgi:hypothetical protein
MKTDKIFDKAQAHIMRNWKTYAFLGAAFLLWTNRDNILSAIGITKKPPALDASDKAATAANSVNSGSVGIKAEDGSIATVNYNYSQSVKNFTNDIYYWYEGFAWTSSTQTERCKIAKQILAMTDAAIAEQNAHYMQTHGKSIYQSFMGVYSDPCSYWATESEYDAALKKLQNATKNITTA